MHADPVTASSRLRETLGSKVGVGEISAVTNADLPFQNAESIRFGEQTLEVMSACRRTWKAVPIVLQEGGRQDAEIWMEFRL